MAITPGGLALRAPAKLNLSLAVLGRRPDGRHHLAGVMVLVDLSDAVSVVPGDGGLTLASANRDPLDDAAMGDAKENLGWRGLRAALGREPSDVAMTIVKRIPVAAGLGGGSSDAAAGWRIGRRLSGADEHVDEASLEGLAALGADVPFFAAAVPAAYVTGIGERIRPLAPRSGGVVIVVPPFRLRTAAVFAELRPGDWSATEPPPAVEPGRNDLIAPALRLRPELDQVLSAIRRAGGEPRMPGSGPACCALTDDPERTRAIAEAVARAGLRAFHTDLLERASDVEPGPRATGERPEQAGRRRTTP